MPVAMPLLRLPRLMLPGETRLMSTTTRDIVLAFVR
jgi:hypothetical protein